MVLPFVSKLPLNLPGVIWGCRSLNTLPWFGIILRPGLAIARSPHLPTSDEELATLGEYLDAFEAKLVTDHTFYLQAKTKARAFIALRLTERVRWDSGQGGAIGAMTAELRDKLLRKTKPKA